MNMISLHRLRSIALFVCLASSIILGDHATAAFGVARRNLLYIYPGSRGRGGGAFTATASRLYAAVSAGDRDEEPSNVASDASSQPKEYKLIESWLTTHLPTLPLADLQTYTAYLYNDGFTTPEKLNSINTPGQGRLEDLYFMKKGHRRVLMKKIGIVRTMRGIEGNRLVRDEKKEGSGSSTGAGRVEFSGRSRRRPRGVNKNLSYDEWIAEQNRQVEKRRLARLAEEEQYRTEYAAAYGTPKKEAPPDQSAKGSDDVGSTQLEQVRTESQPQQFRSGASGETEEYDVVVDDLTSRYQSLKVPIDDHGTAMKGARRLEEMKRDFLNRAKARSEKQAVAEVGNSLVDDLTSRWTTSATRPDDIGHPATDDGGKESQRLEDIKKPFMNRRREQLDESEEESTVDDLKRRYQSLDDDIAHDNDDRAKEARRLEDLRAKFSSTRRRQNGSAEEDFVADDLSTRYLSLDIEAMDDGTRDKEARRLDEIRRAFKNRAREARDSAEPQDVTDDLSARYSSLDIEAMGDGTRDKQSRRLQELKQAFQRRAKLREAEEALYQTTSDDFAARYSSLDIEAMGDGTKGKAARRLRELKRIFPSNKEENFDEEEPLRLDLLERQTREQTAKDRKERIRVEEFQRRARLSAEKKAKQKRSRRLQREEQDEGEEEKKSSDDSDYAGSSNASIPYKTNEKRRLDDLDGYFNKRREARLIAEEERRLEEEWIAKSKEVEQPKGRKKEPVRSTSEVADLNVGLDDFIGERLGARSLSTTMPPTGKGKSTNDLVLMNEDKEEDAYRDITVNNIQERENLSLATTMAPTSRIPARQSSGEGRKVVKATDDEGIKKEETNDSDEECTIGDEDECWDITRQPNFYARESRRSLATTLPPVNTETKTMPANSSTMDGRSTKAESNTVPQDIDSFDIQNSFPESRGRVIRSLATASSPFEDKASARNDERQGSTEADTGASSSSPLAARDSTTKEDAALEPPLPLTEGLTAEEAEMVRTIRLKGDREVSASTVEPPALEVTEGLTAEQAKKAREARLKAADEVAKTLKKSTSAAAPAAESTMISPKRNSNAGDILRHASNVGKTSYVNRRPAPRIVSPLANLPRWSRAQPSSDKKASVSEDSLLFLDITSQFPEVRPSNSCVKERGAMSPHRESSKSTTNEDGSFQDIADFPLERPSLSVNTGTKKRFTTSGSYAERAISSTQDELETSNTESYREKGQIRNIAQNFSPDIPRREISKRISANATSNDYLDTPQFSSRKLSPPPPSSPVMSEKESDFDQQFLDKPRSFDKNLDMVTSNMSGAQFKRSRDKVPVSSLELNASKPRPKGDGQSASANNETSDESSYEEVMSWLLTHLPDIQEDDAVSYFDSLVEDGFDSIDSLDELVEDDLHFMQKQHQRALLKSVQESSTEEIDVVNEDQIKASQSMADALDQAEAELEEIDAWINEQNRLVEERLAARSAEEKSADSSEANGQD